ncbi:MAG: SpoIVB peptidase S55 domain-containing protein [Candidatus Rifleibacteriota bacterium]
MQIFPLADIKAGLKGVGKTVVTGRKIETFDVEILGVLSNNKVNENVLINGKSILVRVSGDAIKRAGGIAAGMSGSPVYIDGKLVGGISSGWVMTDHTVGLVTPIEEMLEIWRYPDTACLPDDSEDETEWVLAEPIEIGGRKIRTIKEVDLDEPVCAYANDQALFRRVGAELFIDGLSGRAMEYFKNRVSKKNFRVVQSTNEKLPEETIKPTDYLPPSAGAYEPGSAIGIQLARGDVNLSTLGTLTHRVNNKILMLAHSFLKKGNVSFLMTGAHIYHSFASVQMPFKIGAPTEMLGIITQDREKGLSGEIGRLPEMVPVQIDVIDKDLNANRSINYQIVRDPSVFNMVLESTMLQALEGVIDREGGGTALMGISLDCANSDGEKYSFRRENMFYSKSDIIQTLINEMTSLIDMVVDNEIEMVMPTRLLIKIEIQKKRRTVAIEKVEVKNSSITSGGILDVEVTLKPFREKSFIRKVKLPIPQELGKENLNLAVYGLNMKIEDADMVGDARENKVARDSKSDEAALDDFDSAIRIWANSPKNSDLLFQLTIEGDEMKKLKLNGKDFEIQPTNLVVTGRVDTTLTLSEE